MRKGFLTLTDVDEFRRIIFATPGTVGGETIASSDALGRIPVSDVRSPIDLPEFRRSTVDGFAVKCTDTHGASDSIPAYLDLVDDIPIGTNAARPITSGAAARVVTGGMIPEGADAVVMLEYAQVAAETTLEIRRPAAHLENVALVGEDIGRADLVVPARIPLRPFDIGALMGVGVTQITVFKKPRVTVFSTGDEVVSPSQIPPVGKVRDINTYAIAAGVTQAGGRPVVLPPPGDDLDLLKKTIRQSVRTSDMVILSGGSSVGNMDFTVAAINGSGSPGVIVHGLAVKPGKPTIYGVVDDVPVLGLPGHPAGAMVVFLLFVSPLIRMIGGSGELEPFGRTITAQITRSVHGSHGRHVYIPVVLEKTDGDEIPKAAPLLGKSGAISILTKSDGIIAIPPMKEGLRAGERVEVFLYRVS
jgi:molybdopterin molybdotransferase